MLQILIMCFMWLTGKYQVVKNLIYYEGINLTFWGYAVDFRVRSGGILQNCQDKHLRK